MQILKPVVHIDHFFAKVGKAKKRALLLDYDGTLAPFQIERDQAVPYPGVRDRLRILITSGHTRVVVITGRWTQDVIPLLGLSPLPEIWGSHGWERLLPDHASGIAPLDEGFRHGLAQAKAWIDSQGWQERCEQKPACLALHWRGLTPEAITDMRNQAQGHWSPIARETGLTLHEFDGGIELRAPGRNKGHAVETIFAEMGAATALAYLGDDLTDEDAFRASATKGLSVLVRPEFRPTAADLWLKPPEELLAFLARWIQACARL
jgi:trehalose-phosphatase